MSNSTKSPIIFFFGPSGVGKTTLAELLREDHNYIHLKIDRADGDGIDIEGLRSEWDKFLNEDDAESLAEALRQKIHEQNKAGIVLTFASTDWLRIHKIEEAKKHRILTVVLYGSKEDCLNSFMAREKIKNRGFDANQRFYPKFTNTDYAKYRLDTFHNHVHRNKSSLIKEVSRRIDANH
jgi:adenylate kinase family enzyme